MIIIHRNDKNDKNDKNERNDRNVMKWCMYRSWGSHHSYLFHDQERENMCGGSKGSSEPILCSTMH